ncbi:hypothetical protein BJF85_01290 [Saccharomonospora sp. CUA-673]|uniref:hypothetical protein n=1 Tax=Saccharomonospora sp. CUA-673 TaxID=1904969 RepID=UPI000958EEFF|nr:hypothetical protein [Saccharomonospora sp. CUA-673]OLT47068.1 hypothetical protein BJF85_01290 [Saccharomonospora sp. CUA-673]
MTRLVQAWRKAVTAELCWTGADGTPAAIAVTPLVESSTVCVALPYARAHEVADLRAAGAATFAVTDSRSLDDRPGVAGSGPVTIIDDLEGEEFVDGLLDQELAKYPPSRALADSVLLRREHWWWLPRIIVRLGADVGGVEDVSETSLPARTNPARHALAVTGARGAAPDVHCVDIGEPGDGAASEAAPQVRNLAGGQLGDGAALLLGYDYTMPDLERWETWTLSGTVTRGALHVAARSGEPGADLPPLGLLARTRRHRRLAKAAARPSAPPNAPTNPHPETPHSAK